MNGERVSPETEWNLQQRCVFEQLTVCELPVMSLAFTFEAKAFMELVLKIILGIAGFFLLAIFATAHVWMVPRDQLPKRRKRENTSKDKPESS